MDRLLGVTVPLGNRPVQRAQGDFSQILVVVVWSAIQISHVAIFRNIRLLLRMFVFDRRSRGGNLMSGPVLALEHLLGIDDFRAVLRSRCEVDGTFGAVPVHTDLIAMSIIFG